MMMVGVKLKKATMLSAVALPVAFHAHTETANAVMAVPVSDMTCPSQTSANALNPVGRAGAMEPSCGSLLLCCTSNS